MTTSILSKTANGLIIEWPLKFLLGKYLNHFAYNNSPIPKKESKGESTKHTPTSVREFNYCPLVFIIFFELKNIYINTYHAQCHSNEN